LVSFFYKVKEFGTKLKQKFFRENFHWIFRNECGHWTRDFSICVSVAFFAVERCRHQLITEKRSRSSSCCWRYDEFVFKFQRRTTLIMKSFCTTRANTATWNPIHSLKLKLKDRRKRCLSDSLIINVTLRDGGRNEKT